MSQSFPFGPEEAALLKMPPEEQLRTLLEYVGTTSKRKRAVATHVLASGGPAIAPLLIRQAFARVKRPTHALRLLDIVSRIGGPVDADHLMLIAAARALPNKIIRAKCSELLVQLELALPNFRPASVSRPRS